MSGEEAVFPAAAATEGVNETGSDSVSSGVGDRTNQPCERGDSGSRTAAPLKPSSTAPLPFPTLTEGVSQLSTRPRKKCKSGQVVASRYLAPNKKRVSSPGVDRPLTLNTTLPRAGESRPISFHPRVSSTPMVRVSATVKPIQSQLTVPPPAPPPAGSQSTVSGERARPEHNKTGSGRLSLANRSQTRDDKLADTVPEHELLYNQYLTWAFMARKSAKNVSSLAVILRNEAEELAGLASSCVAQLTQLKRRHQAAGVYLKLLELRAQLTEVDKLISAESSDAVAQLCRLRSSLGLYTNLLPMKHCVPVHDHAGFIEDVSAAVSQCSDVLQSVCATIGERDSEIERAAVAMTTVSQLLDKGRSHATRCLAVVDRLASLSLMEGSDRLAQQINLSSSSLV